MSNFLWFEPLCHLSCLHIAADGDPLPGIYRGLWRAIGNDTITINALTWYYLRVLFTLLLQLPTLPYLGGPEPDYSRSPGHRTCFLKT